MTIVAFQVSASVMNWCAETQIFDRTGDLSSSMVLPPVNMYISPVIAKVPNTHRLVSLSVTARNQIVSSEEIDHCGYTHDEARYTGESNIGMGHPNRINKSTMWCGTNNNPQLDREAQPMPLTMNRRHRFGLGSHVKS